MNNRMFPHLAIPLYAHPNNRMFPHLAIPVYAHPVGGLKSCDSHNYPSRSAMKTVVCGIDQVDLNARNTQRA